MTSDLRERLRQVDPAPVAAEPPSGALEASAVLHRIERRMGMDTQETTKESTGTTPLADAGPASDPKRLRRTARGGPGLGSRARVAWSAAVVVAVVVAVFAVVNSNSEPSLDAAGAQEIVDQRIAAMNAGEDSAAVLELFTDDSTHSFRFNDTPDQEVTRSEWELGLAWDLAQGTRLVDAACSVIDGVEGEIYTVRCFYQTVDAPSEAAGTAGVFTTARFSVTADGISSLHETYGHPDFNQAGLPFTAWVGANYSAEIEDTVGCCGGDTVAESIARGQARAEYAQLWEAYLVENDCRYNQSRQACLGPDS